MLHPQSRAALETWLAAPSPADPGFGAAAIDQTRRQAREAAAAEPRERVAHVQDVDADGVPCRLYLPEGATGVVLFLHGGGFVFGDLDTHDAQSRRIANRTGLAVLAVDYRRPPEHRFPAAPDDVDTALSWLLLNAASVGLDLSRIVALGDSAGANLALVAALRNPNAFAATVLVYPFIDPAGRFHAPALDGNGLSAAECAWYWEQYGGPAGDLAHPDIVPLDSAGLGTLPPTLVLAADQDILLGEDVELARRIEAAGAEVTLSVYPGMIHGFWRHPELFDAAEESLAEIAGFLRRTV